MPRGTVVVCTRNRRQLLLQCLASLDQQVGEPPVEVLAVDDGSTDGTAAALDRWAAAGPARRVVHQPPAGLSVARNTGLQHATGDVVLFCDDDALLPPGWAAAHLRAHASDPRIAMVGGPVHLTFPDGCPRWVTPQLHHWWSALSGGDVAGPFPTAHGPYGANLSVRRELALAVGGFAPWLGRNGRSLVSSEEADLTQRIAATGATIWWEPSAPVLHQITAARLRRRWLVRRALAQGRSNARRLAHPGSDPGRRRLLRLAGAEAGQAARVAHEALRATAPPPADGSGRDSTWNTVGRLAGHAAASAELLRHVVAHQPPVARRRAAPGVP